MSAFAFRLTCKLAGCDIEAATREVALVLRGLEQAVSMNCPKDGGELVLWCGGFASETDARDVGTRVKQAVMLTGVLIGIGIDAGNDEESSAAFRRVDGQSDEGLQPNVHGLQIVPELDGMLFGGIVFGRPVSRVTVDQLDKQINEAFGLNRLITKKQRLAAQLYNQSHFHTADAAQFLTLVSAVEALAERVKRSTTSQKAIDDLLKMVAENGKLHPLERETLKNGLGNLRDESIGGACRALVESVVGADEGVRFKQMYVIRSKMLHEGEPPAGTDLGKEIRELDGIVRRLIAGHVSRT